MAGSLTEAASEKGTKAAPMPATSAKRRSRLFTSDGSALTEQDTAMLAVLAELQKQGYPMKIVNYINKDGSKVAAILLPGRVWK